MSQKWQYAPEMFELTPKQTYILLINQPMNTRTKKPNKQYILQLSPSLNLYKITQKVMVPWYTAINTPLHSILKEGKANPNDINFKTIEAVQVSSFAQILYMIFSTLLCKKVRLWNLEPKLPGIQKFPTGDPSL